MPIEQHRRKDIFGDISNGNIVVGGAGDGKSWPFGQVLTLLSPLIGDIIFFYMHVHLFANAHIYGFIPVHRSKSVILALSCTPIILT